MKKESELKRLLGYAGKRRVCAPLSWALAAVGGLMALAPFYCIWRILRLVLTGDGGSGTITRWGWAAVAFAVGAVLIYIAGLIFSHLAAFRIATNLRIALTRHIAVLPLGQMESMGSGRLRRTITETAGAAETYLAHQLPDKARAMATVAGLLALLLVFDWRLGLLSLVPVALGMVCMTAMTGKSLQEKMGQYQNALSDMSNQAVEYVRGIPVVKTFGQTIFSFKKFKATIDNYQEWTIAYTKQLRGPMMAYTLAINSVFVFLIVGGFWFSRGGVTEELLLNILFYIIITPVISLTLTKLMFMSENGMIVKDAIGRMDAVLNVPPLAEPKDPKKPADASVSLDHVTFWYEEGKNALDDVSLSLRPGEMAALVGPSGGGKSTLAALVARFYDPQEGAVRIGGVDIRDMTKDDVMANVSFVFQHSHLIKGTLLDNVRLGRPEATEAEVMTALERAECQDIVEKLPQGIHTVIDSGDGGLSGGESQRIAIARAILKDAPVLILDEATAFADPDREAGVQAAINELAKGRTVIFIAHRLSTVKNADHIFVLKDGKIVEDGGFQALTEKAGGVFARMWRDYQSSIAWKVEREEC